MDTGRRISHLRRERGVSRADFAEALGIDQSTIHYWELDKHAPRADLMAKALAYFGLTAGQFWADDFPRSLPEHLKGGKR